MVFFISTLVGCALFFILLLSTLVGAAVFFFGILLTRLSCVAFFSRALRTGSPAWRLGVVEVGGLVSIVTRFSA